MNLLTTPQLAARWKCTGRFIRLLHDQGRIKPAVMLPNGQYLWSEKTRRPAHRKPGPKPATRPAACY